MPASDGPDCFIDTNVWLYALIDEADEAKKTVSRELIDKSLPAVSTQVVNETCVNLMRKSDFSEDKVRLLIESFYDFYHVIELERHHLEMASLLRSQFSLSFWDSLIVATAIDSGVSVLYSEDMQHGLTINQNLRIQNPFLDTIG